MATNGVDIPLPHRPAADGTLQPPPAERSIFEEGWLKKVYNEVPVGKDVITRFPPEPNGFLHIGHAKAIAVNFGFAKHYGGKCWLRFDDTNPTKEEERYFTAIKEVIEWLGYEPYGITYSSDYFDRLYEIAEHLTKKGKAYVCHCTKEETEKWRGGVKREIKACVHRDRPPEESLKELRRMRDGEYEPKEAVLRLKQDLDSGNSSMWDLTAYRVTAESYHYRSKDKWRIYPAYDFTHCLCDSFEHITHSLCTTEFINNREAYEWVLNESDVPYGRLNLIGTITSKSKITLLVEGKDRSGKIVNKPVLKGWDDPRLYTLVALRRRGIPPGAIRAFVSDLGVSTALTSIEISRFEFVVRSYLERTVPRLMVVLDPIKVILDNLPDSHHEYISLPFDPKNPALGTHTVPFTKTLFIDSSDFRASASADPNFFRLAPGKSVGLIRVPFPITATSFTTDPATGRVAEIRATYDIPTDAGAGAKPKKPKAWIHWVGLAPAHGSPIKAEVRISNRLFRADDPANALDWKNGGWMQDLNPNSEEVYPNAMVEIGLMEIRARGPWPKKEEGYVTREGEQGEEVAFQGLRTAYFAVDRESSDVRVVLNRVVGLKEDASKEEGMREGGKVEGGEGEAGKGGREKEKGKEKEKEAPKEGSKSAAKKAAKKAEKAAKGAAKEGQEKVDPESVENEGV